MTSPETIITDAEISEKHWGNWGGMSPRAVVNEGVLKYAYGFSSGYTQLQILLSHKLLKKPKPGSYRADLTQKGKAYARTLWSTRTDLCDPMQDPRVVALASVMRRIIGDTYWRTNDNTLYPDAIDALSAITKEPPHER